LPGGPKGGGGAVMRRRDRMERYGRRRSTRKRVPIAGREKTLGWGFSRGGEASSDDEEGEDKGVSGRGFWRQRNGVRKRKGESEL